MLKSIYTYGRLIKFSHTIFAMPFALSAVILAHKSYPVTLKTLLWIILAMVSARSSAMGFNRWADIPFDRLNPRTASRPSVTGEISEKALLLLIVTSSLVFILSAYNLGKLCFILSFPTLGILFSYSYAKRFTSLSHLHLGFAIGLAPLGAWIAITGSLDGRIIVLSLALLTYIAGFDVLYACQDVEFDRTVGLYSLPSKVGIKKALVISAILHVITFICLIFLIPLFSLGSIYKLFLIPIGCLLMVEHIIVRPGDLTKIPMAFFHVNSIVSLLILIGIGLDVML